MSINNNFKLIKYFNIFLLALSFLLPAFAYQYLPENLPIHFDLYGKPDSYSERNSIWLLPIFSLIIWIIFWKVRKVIKNEVANKSHQQLLIKSLSLLLLAVLLLFVYINLQVILISLGFSGGLGIWFYVFFVLVFVLPLCLSIGSLLVSKNKKPHDS